MSGKYVRPIESYVAFKKDLTTHYFLHRAAILDRFMHHAEIITIKGRSYRLKDRATKNPPAASASKTKEPEAK